MWIHLGFEYFKLELLDFNNSMFHQLTDNNSNFKKFSPIIPTCKVWPPLIFFKHIRI
ncbi:hypothetical protein HanRHA438_Chr12g0572621 [Helianthus annuus]|nr:hypothetical protein HanRHA438_Chr12g0572621 [Helianthus annuus]